MNIITNFGFKCLIIILSIGSIFSAPIKQIDPWTPLLPERHHFQVDTTLFITPNVPPPSPIYLPKISEIIYDRNVLNENEPANTLLISPL